MRTKKVLWNIISGLLVLLLAGCGVQERMEQGAADLLEDLKSQAEEGAKEVLKDISGPVEAGLQKVMDGLDALENAERKGGPFENNLESARAYMLEQLREKYGREFVITGRETLKNYGPFAGASYSCEVAPADAPEQTAMALVSQTMYQDVRDSWALYYFKDEAEAPANALCAEKEYVKSYRVDLRMPGTARTWTPEDGVDRFLQSSGAYLYMKLGLEPGLTDDAYADQILDFLDGVYELNADVDLYVLRAGETGFFNELFFGSITVLGPEPSPPVTRERVLEQITRA